VIIEKDITPINDRERVTIWPYEKRPFAANVMVIGDKVHINWVLHGENTIADVTLLVKTLRKALTYAKKGVSK